MHGPAQVTAGGSVVQVLLLRLLVVGPFTSHSHLTAANYLTSVASKLMRTSWHEGAAKLEGANWLAACFWAALC